MCQALVFTKNTMVQFSPQQICAVLHFCYPYFMDFYGLGWHQKRKEKHFFSVIFFVLYIRKVYLNLSWWIKVVMGGCPTHLVWSSIILLVAKDLDVFRRLHAQFYQPRYARQMAVNTHIILRGKVMTHWWRRKVSNT